MKHRGPLSKHERHRLRQSILLGLLICLPFLLGYAFVWFGHPTFSRVLGVSFAALVVNWTVRTSLSIRLSRMRRATKELSASSVELRVELRTRRIFHALPQELQALDDALDALRDGVEGHDDLTAHWLARNEREIPGVVLRSALRRLCRVRRFLRSRG